MAKYYGSMYIEGCNTKLGYNDKTLWFCVYRGICIELIKMKSTLVVFRLVGFFRPQGWMFI